MPIFLGKRGTPLSWDAYKVHCLAVLEAVPNVNFPLTRRELRALGFESAAMPPTPRERTAA